PSLQPQARLLFDGCTEAIVLAHGFSISQLVELVRRRPGSASAQRVVAGKQGDGGRGRAHHRGGAAGARGDFLLSPPKTPLPLDERPERAGQLVVRPRKFYDVLA